MFQFLEKVSQCANDLGADFGRVCAMVRQQEPGSQCKGALIGQVVPRAAGSKEEKAEHYL